MIYSPPSEETRHAFHQGTCDNAYTFLGVHTLYMNETEYYCFAVWAPNAIKVCLTGEFCEWAYEKYPMQKQFDGIWELYLPQILFSAEQDKEKYNYKNAEQKLKTYKFAILGQDGAWHLKSDPYAFSFELRPNNSSRIDTCAEYMWHDKLFMQKRKRNKPYQMPINIYEMHLGTWKQHEDHTYYTYEETAKELVPYLTEMHYTHVEFLPIMEHPLDMSWGYQVTGYYAPTTRYGDMNGLKYLIDQLHMANISVILDWVPAHFPKDEIGLRQFDGSCLYENENPLRGEMKQWGTHLFDFGRGEACSFLLSNALYYFREFHVDGLRCDAVSAILYLDFCKEEGEYVLNKHGTNLNEEGIAFLKTLNEHVYNEHKNVLMIAEESSAFKGVTTPTDQGGLGFYFKWNMGWMNDMLSYIKFDPVYRQYHHDKLTFSFMYAFNENYILPFSHDEVVHGKCSMLNKQPGDIWQKFAGLRALIGYQYAHPGKKLTFMGSEFAQFIEWKDDDCLDWFLLVYQKHPEFKKYIEHLNFLYKSTPALYEMDNSWGGFTWLNADDKERSVCSFLRWDHKGRAIAVITNFTPSAYENYKCPFPFAATLTEVLNSDDEMYCGSDVKNTENIKTKKENIMQMPYCVTLRLPPLATVFYTIKKHPVRKTTKSKTNTI